ncbi:hypothetical protein CASFOL_017202 [Castilleja foliolosa]|uniref:FAF domain-containing protein n=1 Tax=Castilleja foliolosa TaxID=1961234 RepID=A0ABD3DEM8_9LAMI
MHSPDLAEFIGAESCFILESDVADYIPPPAATNNHRRSRMVAPAEKEYPPPLERFPSVMTKCITGDGRVVLKKEKVKRQEYLRAHRSDGTFLLNLHVEEEFDDDDDMDGGDDGVKDDVDPTAAVKEEEKVGSSSCYNNVYNESGVINNATCGGLAPVAAFGPPPVLT